jgi:hypothetical protein
VCPLELARPDGQPQQHQRYAARAGDGPGGEAEADQEQTGDGDRDAVHRELARVLPDPAAPPPAVLLRLDQHMVVVVVVRMPGGAGDNRGRGHGGRAVLGVVSLVALGAG